MSRATSPHEPPPPRVSLLRKLLTLIHPAPVRKGSVDLRMTWAMGTLAFFFFLEMIVTGMLLMFSYRPTLDDAYLDMLQLQATPSILRPLHRWGASALLITLILHLFRVFLTGTYKAPRQANWMIGVVLLVLTVFMSTTGSLLPMDQQAFWSLTVAAARSESRCRRDTRMLRRPLAQVVNRLPQMLPGQSGLRRWLGMSMAGR